MQPSWRRTPHTSEDLRIEHVEVDMHIDDGVTGTGGRGHDSTFYRLHERGGCGIASDLCFRECDGCGIASRLRIHQGNAQGSNEVHLRRIEIPHARQHDPPRIQGRVRHQPLRPFPGQRPQHHPVISARR